MSQYDIRKQVPRRLWNRTDPQVPRWQVDIFHSVGFYTRRKSDGQIGRSALKLSTFTRMDDDWRHAMLRSGALIGLKGERPESPEAMLRYQQKFFHEQGWCPAWGGQAGNIHWSPNCTKQDFGSGSVPVLSQTLFLRVFPQLESYAQETIWVLQ